MRALDHAAARKSAPLPSASRAARPSSAKGLPTIGIGNQDLQRLLLQPKLTVNEPGDAFEQQADRAADAVMRMPLPRPAADAQDSARDAIPRLQRMCADCDEQLNQSRPTIGRMCDHCEEELEGKPEDELALQAKEVPGRVPEVTAGVQAQIDSLGTGQTLPAAERDFFEPRFGRDFGQVRLHTDSRAAEATRMVQARAFTTGRNVVLGAGEYAPGTTEGRRLLAHELTHVIQQGASGRNTSEQAASQVSDVIQRAGDPAAIPLGFACPTDLTPGRPAGTDLLFPSDRTNITAAHTALLTTFRATWLAAGGTDNILVHGYASTDGNQGPNWTLSCNRAIAARDELIRLGIPAVRIEVVAHGESTDFGPSAAANRHAVVSTSTAGFISLPLVTGVLTARDNFAGRSITRFGVGEVIDLNFFSLPPRPAVDFGGLQWHLAAGAGTLVTGVANDGTGTYTAPATASAVRLELRVATGATAGRVVSTHAITIVIPSRVNMVAVPGSAPSFVGGTAFPPIAAGTWGAGFLADVFVDPKDVSFRGVVFGEGAAPAVATPPGSFLSVFGPHPANTFGPAHGGNATTGTQVSPPRDQAAFARAPAGSLLGTPTCGTSDFLWAIPWQFSVAGAPRAPFAGGFTANQHATSTFFCNATVEKAGAGPFCRRINGTIC